MEIEHHPVQFLGHIHYPGSGAACETAIIYVDPAVSHRADLCPLRIVFQVSFDSGLTEKNNVRVPGPDMLRIANEVCRLSVCRRVGASGKLDHIILEGPGAGRNQRVPVHDAKNEWPPVPGGRFKIFSNTAKPFFEGIYQPAAIICPADKRCNGAEGVERGRNCGRFAMIDSHPAILQGFPDFFLVRSKRKYQVGPNAANLSKSLNLQIF